MIISLEELKRALGLDPDDTSEDEALEELLTRATAWLEGQTKWRFQEPVATVEYRFGSGRLMLYTRDRIAGPAEADPDYVYITVEHRYGNGDWETLEEGVDYERRGEQGLIRLDGFPWAPNAEYRLTYNKGFHEAEVPEDIKALLIELVAIKYGADAEVAAGTEGLSSEKIGDYSYTFSSSSSSSSGGGATSLSDDGYQTLNRWKRLQA